jgi:hypothetical protein
MINTVANKICLKCKEVFSLKSFLGPSMLLEKSTANYSTAYIIEA